MVKVQNPNNFTLQGTKLQLGVDVEGSHLGDVTYDSDFTVSENGITTTSVSFAHEGRVPLIRAGTVAIPGVGPS